MTDKDIKDNLVNEIKNEDTDDRSYDLLTFDFLLNEISKSITLTSDEEEKLHKAYNIAVKYHSAQLRNSGEPYVNHCIWTAIYISQQKLEIETIIAGLLHDILEDTTYTEDMMMADFCPVIVRLVLGVTKMGTVKYRGLERHAESLRKFIISMSEDIRVVVIKLCDRLHNMQTLQYVKPEKRHRIASETIDIYARLADRLGMGKLKSELEDLAFPFINEAEYNKTVAFLKEVQTADDITLRKITDKLKEELSAFDVKVEDIDYRVKRLYSIWKKLKKNKYDTSKLNDLLAIRIIVPEINDCYAVLGIVHGLYKIKPGRFKDYISNPKINGYQSLHTTIFTGTGYTIEIQIKTVAMHEEAEYGICSHTGYKEKISKNKIEKINWTNALLDWQNDIENNSEFLKTVKNDFLSNRIFVFTPNGDVIDLPDGATGLDFAYSVHSDVGNKTAQIYVNGKLVPFNYKLKSNDTVRIETKINIKPSRKWLSSVITHNAKKQITHWIKENGGLMDKLFIR